MAEPAGKGTVDQRNIDAVAAPLVNQYQNSKNYSKEFNTKIDESNPSW